MFESKYSNIQDSKNYECTNEKFGIIVDKNFEHVKSNNEVPIKIECSEETSKDKSLNLDLKPCSM